MSLTPHARFLRSKIDHISANSKQTSERFRPWISGPGGIVWWKKNPKVENLVALSLEEEDFEFIGKFLFVPYKFYIIIIQTIQ
jgi:hypothetical protein